MSDLPTIVLTGATGKIGIELVKRLAGKSNFKIRATYTNSWAKTKLFPPGVEVVHIDYSQPETVLSALKGANKLYFVPIGQRDKVPDTQMVVKAAQQAGIEHIVAVSGFAPDLAPMTDYDRIFIQVEEIIAQSGIAYTFLRPTWFNQNFLPSQNFAWHIEAGILSLPMGEGKTAWIDTRDIAMSAAQVLSETGHESQTYTLTGPQAYSLDEVTRIIYQVSGRDIKYKSISGELYRQMLANMGIPGGMAQRMVDLMLKFRAGYHAQVTQDIEKVTGKKPISFEQYALDHADLLKQL